MNNYIKVLILMIVFLPVLLFAGMDTVYVHSDIAPNEGAINSAIQTVIDQGKLSTTAFKLDPAGYYILSGSITVPPNQHFTMVADQPGTTAPPQIFLSSQVTISYFIDCFGDLTLKNLWVTYATPGGVQRGSPIEFDDDTLRHKNTGEFEGVIFDYCPIPGAVEVRSTHLNASFKNCYWRNNIDPHYRYYGRAISFPFNTTTWHQDTIKFENCTMANMGYAYMGYQPGEATPETVDFVSFNHCTFFNCMMHSLEPSFWQWASVTNCVFTNIWMFGDIITNRETPWQLGGMINIDSFAIASNAIFPLVNNESGRHILLANNSYSLEKWLTDFMDHNSYSDSADANHKPNKVPMLSPRTLTFFDSINANSGTKVWPYINRANLYDGVDPGYIAAPTNQQSIKDFLLGRWKTGANVDWSYNYQDDIGGIWPMNEDLGYSNTTLQTAGMGGFPLGDLYHWWPTQYAAWNGQAAAENSRIINWLTTGQDNAGVEKIPGAIPNKYDISQNYPNPFNPMTRIDYSIPEKNHVTLKVYNLIGQEVATLFDGVQQAGKYTATFDGKSLASGVYFYRLQTNEFSVTKKLLLVK